MKAIAQLMPNENLVYVADSRYTPYGERSNDFIAERVEAIAAFLDSLPVKAIVVACNTATAAAIHMLREKYDFPIIGLEPAIKPAIALSENQRVGVIATQSTLDSQKYSDLKSRLIANAQASCELIEKASNYFVELVESATEIDTQVKQIVGEELSPFIEAKVDALVLGCTHYPFLTELIQEILGEEIQLFESGMPVARELQRRLENKLNDSASKGTIEYYSTNPELAQKQFEKLLKQATLIKTCRI